MRLSFRGTSLAVAVASVAVAGCTAVGGVTQAPVGTTDAPESVRPGSALAQGLALFSPSEEGAQAELRGVLREVGACLVVVDENDDTWLTAWPATARWDTGSKTITIETGELAVGEVGLFGGGEGYVESSTEDPYDWVQRPDVSCLPAPVWFVHTLQTAGG